MMNRVEIKVLRTIHGKKLRDHGRSAEIVKGREMSKSVTISQTTRGYQDFLKNDGGIAEPLHLKRRNRKIEAMCPTVCLSHV